MKKIGIITLYNNNYNYGGILQAYALCKTINDMGNECKVIDYSGNRNIIYTSLKERIRQYNLIEIFKKSRDIIDQKVNSKKIQLIVNKRKEMFDIFCNEYIPHTRKYIDDNIYELNKELDFFISGSDQVWNPNCALGVFLQDFVDNDKKKISYAASISRNNLSEYEKNKMIPLIRKFKYISIREETGKRLLESCGIENVYTVVDPTMLLTKNQWEKIATKSIEEKPYVLCYFFSNSKKYREKIDNFCNEKKMKLLFIPYAKQKYTNTDSKGKGIPVNNVGPREFLSLIKNAEYIFTDSFHGLVFSIIFNKKFIVFERDRSNENTSKNSRIYDLLKLFSLEDRLIRGESDFEDVIEKDINVRNINHIISGERERAFNFLNNAIK